VSDLRVIGFVGAAHFLSHFFQLSLPPLFPLMKDELGVGYVALGLAMTVFYGTSGIGQTIAGFLVDRVGGRRVLLCGMTILASAIGLAGFAPSYWLLLPLLAVAGVGNAVFHPADLSILTTSVDERRLGRAYSVHGLSGSLGYAAGPPVIVAVAGFLGWRFALVAAGVVGLIAVVYFAAGTRGLAAPRAFGRGKAGTVGDLRHLMTAPILAAFAYFALLATATIGTQTFSVASLVALYDAPLAVATTALTVFLLGKAAGILAGGFLADRTHRHDVVAVAGMVSASAMMLVVATAGPALAAVVVAMTLCGFSLGTAQPSRDLLVRAATPAGSSGKVFGFVYSGLDLGSSLTPLLFGWLLDHGAPRAVFLLVAGFMALSIVTVLQVRRQGRAAVPARA
jgi:MFS transporter, FSR family, fosmidomycin resistance protein